MEKGARSKVKGARSKEQGARSKEQGARSREIHLTALRLASWDSH